MRNALKILKWSWRSIGKISWTDRVKDEVLYRCKEEKTLYVHNTKEG